MAEKPIPRKVLTRLQQRELERRKKTVFGELGPSGQTPMAGSLSRNNAVRARGLDQAARIGVAHQKPKKTKKK